VLFERAYSPASFDYAVEQIYGHHVTNAPVIEISVTVRAQEAMARRLATTPALAPLSQPVADLMRDTLTIRPFDPPWFMNGSVVWRRDNHSAPLVAFVAAAAASGNGHLGGGDESAVRTDGTALAADPSRPNREALLHAHDVTGRGPSA
jgi:hypothetical protein